MWIAAHTKVVVGAPHCDPLVFIRHMGTGEFLGKTGDVVEVAVGFVPVFLVELSSIESFVVEMGYVVGSDGRSSGSSGSSSSGGGGGLGSLGGGGQQGRRQLA